MEGLSESNLKEIIEEYSLFNNKKIEVEKTLCDYS